MDEEATEHQETEFDAEMYLEILRDNPPMKRYVSRGDIPDSVDVEGPHEDADRAIFRALRFVMNDGTPRFQPVLGSAGLGKTHLYWALKDRENELDQVSYLAVYVPSPPAPVRVPLHFHACLVDEAGEEIFESAIDMLMTKMRDIKGEPTEVYDYDLALNRLLVDYPGISADVVKALLRYRLDPGNKDVARRWLLGDALDDEEMERLDVRTILEDDDVTMATLKLLFEGADLPILLFIDEMEGPYNTHGEDGERHFLEIIKRIYNEGKNVAIVASCLTDIWDRIYEIADEPTRTRMEEPVHLRKFEKEDIERFIIESMNQYWSEQNIATPPNPTYPLGKKHIEEAFEVSDGNPREALRHLIPLIDSILFGTEPEPVEPQADYVIKLTAPVVINSIATGLQQVGEQEGIEVSLMVAKGVADRQATAILQAKKGDTTKRIAIDVANVKDWNRSGGVAAYYSVKRLKEIMDQDEADFAIVAVPEETGGTKFQAISDDLGDKLTSLKLTEDSARSLVSSTTEDKLDAFQSQVFKDILTKLF